VSILSFSTLTIKLLVSSVIKVELPAVVILKVCIASLATLGSSYHKACKYFLQLLILLAIHASAF